MDQREPKGIAVGSWSCFQEGVAAVVNYYSERSKINATEIVGKLQNRSLAAEKHTRRLFRVWLGVTTCI